MPRGRITLELLFGLGVAALGVALAAGTAAIRLVPVYARVGPHVFPAIVSAGLVVVGLALAADALAARGRAGAG
ncbi:MAG TPA: tripartite tricarboxylate transporter TctB family protein, partial [Thermodesulfobacteriota bacterium]|nr:tripartite tricarboxylate transporter TctB family protein [Thermodesulfobacteriota bacterium]